MDAGNKQWGDLIQRDIIEGTQWAAEQGRIDNEKICIMGTSFGGYSALQAPTMAPELYKCAVAEAGVYDLNLLHEEGDVTSMFTGDAFLETVIGQDEAQLKAYSPVYNIDKFSIPLFLAHGGNDQRAPLEHAEALKQVLDENNKDYEWFYKKNEGHGFFNEVNRIEYFEKVADFLGKHLQ